MRHGCHADHLPCGAKRDHVARLQNRPLGFGEIGACGLHDSARVIDAALQDAFAYEGPVLVDVITATEELAMPPQIKFEQAKGFSLYMLRAVISGRGDEVVELAKTNWLR